MAEDERFLSRWSRRKIAEKQREDVRLPDLSEPPAEPPEGDREVALDEAAAEGPEPGEADRHPAEDIDIDSLTRDSDFTVFMEKGVPAALRRRALRKLWTSDPVLANLDGLNDYEDMEWTYGLSEVAKTDWQLGRGFLTDKDLGLEPGDDPAGPDAPEESGEPDDVVSGVEDADRVAAERAPDDTTAPENDDDTIT